MTERAVRYYCVGTVLVLLLISIVMTLGQQEETCYADNNNPYVYYDAKTAYEFVHGKNRISPPESCKPVQIWLVMRHGTRYPKSSDIARLRKLSELRDEIMSNHEQGRGKLCNKDLQNLKEWFFKWIEEEGNTLTHQGYQDLFTFAQRIKSSFREILNVSYSEDRFKFRHTDTQRTHASCEAFIEGMFGDAAASVYVPPAIPNDPLIHGYKNCTAWYDSKEKLKNEMNLFDKSVLMKNLISSVSQRLGFSYNLSAENITNIYNMCRFSKARYLKSISPWCAAFTTQELQILEYSKDLYYYYTTGYGFDMNLKLGCPLVRDMIEQFSKLENTTEGQPSGIFYFTHEVQVNMLSSRFGFNRDIHPPTHKNYDEMLNRKFRSSLILPFASNIMAVFYKCTSDEENRIMFYQNERVVNYEQCTEGLCSWKYIKEKFSDVIKPGKCNIDFCLKTLKTNKGNTASFHNTTWIITLIILTWHYLIS